MVLRKCDICDRKFKKTEHYKRHERSHTKERPYECTVCHKRFSRSDVLSRHAKGHVQNASTNDVTKKATNDTRTGPTVAGPETVATNADTNASLISTVPNADCSDVAFQAGSDFSHVRNDHRFNSVMTLQSTTTSSHHQENIDGTQLSPNGGLAQTHIEGFPQETQGVQTTAADELSSNLDFFAALSANQPRAQTQIDVMNLDEQHPLFVNWDLPAFNVAEPHAQTQCPTAHDPVPNEMFNLWLEPRSDSISYTTPPLDFMQDMSTTRDGGSLSQRLGPSSQQRSKTVEDIPAERFSRVERIWGAPENKVGRLINTIWHDVARHDFDNIFAISPWSSSSSSIESAPGSRFGLDEECRTRLQNAFELLPSLQRSLNSGTSNAASLSPAASSTGSGSILNFPPAEILDMALDLYFRKFHPLVPIVHLPTFCARETRPSLLFVMCQIGMVILGTKGTTNFVSKTFRSSLARVTYELGRGAVGNETSAGILSTFATALLMLHLASMTGENLHAQECQMLYVNLISIAQRHGLFAAGDGQLIGMSLFEAVPDLEARWKAWSRVESTKRLIVGLVLLDSSFSSYFSTSPIIFPGSIRFSLPCHNSLFGSSSSSRWMQHIRDGKRIVTSTIDSPSETTAIPIFEAPIDEFCIHNLLGILQLRLAEAYHRLLYKQPRYPFAPCHTYAMDDRARCLPRLQVQFIYAYGESLSTMNPNCSVMWHQMCMNLTADIQIFDLAAGRNGAGPAREALDDISAWAQTAAARRACLHAAQIFKAISNRRASDETTFHSAHALFSAALVLGLYTYKAPHFAEFEARRSCFELLDDVDWHTVGTEGFEGLVEPRNTELTPISTDDQAVNFIRYGGPICIRGAPYPGGYQSARRILLDYGSLLKDTGKWSVRKFSYVLHIMSDVLMEFD